MPFLNPDELRAVRLRNATKFPIPGTTRSLNVLQLGAARTQELAQIEGKLKAAQAAGPKEHAAAQRDLFLFMIEGGCADEKGDILTAEDAQQLYAALTLDEISSLANAITDSIKPKTAVVAPGTPDAGNSAGSTVAG